MKADGSAVPPPLLAPLDDVPLDEPELDDVPLEEPLEVPLELPLVPLHWLAQLDAPQVASACPALLHALVRLELQFPMQVLSEQSQFEKHERNAEHDDSAVESCEPHELCSQEVQLELLVDPDAGGFLHVVTPPELLLEQPVAEIATPVRHMRAGTAIFQRCMSHSSSFKDSARSACPQCGAWAGA